jgi:predicted nicotinamide N-methyase
VRFRYRTIEFGDIDIHMRTLRDTNEAAADGGLSERLGVSPSNWPLSGVVWASSLVLAGLMVRFDIEGARILEVGCGLGLASMVLNHRGADITATDMNPAVELFLLHNAALNGAPAIPFERTDWHDDGDSLGRFDLIIGSDLLYERDQAAPLSRFIDDHAHPRARTILVDPGRGQVGRFVQHMGARGFAHTKGFAIDDASLHFGRTPPHRAQIHTFDRG